MEIIKNEQNKIDINNFKKENDVEQKEEEELTLNFNIQKLPCDICKTTDFKYKCPKCLTKTCSLKCINHHKQNLKCDGKKDKFSSKKIKELDEKDMYRDMKYMTEMINDYNRSSKKLYNIDSNEEIRLKEKKQKNLKKLAKKFRNMNLELCPSNLSKFNENKSYCDSKIKKFFWTIKFHFIEGQFIKKEQFYSYLIDDPIDDSEFTLKGIVKKYVFENKKDLDIEILKIMKNYSIGDIEKFDILIKSDNEYKLDDILVIGKKRYEIINGNQLLMNFLNNRTIFEYPEFYIVLKNK
jgi:hypothetical protein